MGQSLPTPEDDRDRKLLADINEVGWAVLLIEADEDGPGFAYSIGMWHTFGHAEFLIMGLPSAVAGQLINDLGEAVRRGQQFEAGRQYQGVARGFPVTFVAMAQRYYREYLGYANWFHRGPTFPVLQCIWPDKQGRFPGQPDYDSRFFQLQRVLGG